MPTRPFDTNFDLKAARDARINMRLDGKAAQQAAGAAADKAGIPNPKVKPIPKPAGPTTAGKIGEFAKNTGKALMRPVGTTIKNAAKQVVGTAWKGAKLVTPVGLAVTGATMVNDKVNQLNTDTQDLNARMISDDPAVSGQALAEYRAANPDYKSITRPGAESPVAPVAPETPAAPVTATAATPAPGAVADPAAPVATDPQGGNAPAQTPYAPAKGQSNSDILTRPTMGKDGQPVIDPKTGKAVPEFTDSYAATGMARPATSPQDLAAEQAKADEAKQMYEANTTGSDGRRYFGGPENEKLRALQTAESLKGDPSGAVGRQLAGEGLTPEQRAAYAADPTGAYQVDAQANASTAKAQLDAFKYQQTQQRNATTDARLVQSAATKDKATALTHFKDYPDVYQKLSEMIDQQYDPNSGETMSAAMTRVLSFLELDEGIPQVVDGKLLQKSPQDQEQPEPGFFQKTVGAFF